MAYMAVVGSHKCAKIRRIDISLRSVFPLLQHPKGQRLADSYLSIFSVSLETLQLLENFYLKDGIHDVSQGGT